jgi:hypothetical protein
MILGSFGILPSLPFALEAAELKAGQQTFDVHAH